MAKAISQSFARAVANLGAANLEALQYALSNRSAFVSEFGDGEFVTGMSPDGTRPTLQRIMQLLDPDDEQLSALVMGKVTALMGLVSMSSMIAMAEEKGLGDEVQKLLHSVERLVSAVNTLDGRAPNIERAALTDAVHVPSRRTLH